MRRRLRNRCYLCGDPPVDGWYCAAHLWAGNGETDIADRANGLERITREHAYWIERFTPSQIVELADHLEPVA